MLTFQDATSATPVRGGAWPPHKQHLKRGDRWEGTEVRGMVAITSVPD
jgi:hypothetical protein